jgi:DNA-directed RNA polymerase III subunit RPC1
MGQALLPYEIMEIVDQELSTERFVGSCSQPYLDLVRDFMKQVVQKVVAIRRSHGLPDALVRTGEWGRDANLSFGVTGLYPLSINLRFYDGLRLEAEKALMSNKAEITAGQIQNFLEICWVKYVKARIEPGLFIDEICRCD